MLITSDELIERKIHLKTWLHELQVGGKAANAPSFPLSGPDSANAKAQCPPAPGRGSYGDLKAPLHGRREIQADWR